MSPGFFLRNLGLVIFTSYSVSLKSINHQGNINQGIWYWKSYSLLLCKYQPNASSGVWITITLRIPSTGNGTGASLAWRSFCVTSGTSFAKRRGSRPVPSTMYRCCKGLICSSLPRPLFSQESKVAWRDTYDHHAHFFIQWSHRNHRYHYLRHLSLSRIT